MILDTMKNAYKKHTICVEVECGGYCSRRRARAAARESEGGLASSDDDSCLDLAIVSTTYVSEVQKRVAIAC